MEQQRPFFVPFPRPDLIGRDEALEQLHATLQRGDAAVTPALVGQGGVGKTQLAVRYAWDYGGHYPGGVFWLNCADPTPTSLLGQMASYAEQMGLAPGDLGGDADAVDRRLARIWIADLHKRPAALLVLDGLEEPSLLTRELPGVPDARLPGLGCRLLVTSRLRGLPGCADVPVEWLSPEASRALLLREAGRPADGEGAAIDTVCALLGGLPLAIRLAGALMRRHRMDFQAFAELLGRRGAASALSAPGVPLENYRDNLAVALSALLTEHWDTLAAEQPELNEILHCLALFPPTYAVSLTVLQRLVYFSSDSWNEAADELHRLGLIERLKSGLVRLHPLIRHYILGHVSDDFSHVLAQRAADTYDNMAGMPERDQATFACFLESLRAGGVRIPGPQMPGYFADAVEGYQDALNVEPDAISFARLIAAKDVLPPLAIGLFGDWGAGKSFFMKLLRTKTANLATQAKRKNVPQFCTEIVQIDFNAWHYAEANLWTSLVSHTFGSLHAYLKPKIGEEQTDRLFSELESAKKLKADADVELTLAKQELKEVEQELVQKRKEAMASLNIKKILTQGFWIRFPFDQLPQRVKTRIEELQREARLDDVVGSTEQLWRKLQEARGLGGWMRALFRSFMDLPIWQRAFIAVLLSVAAFLVIDLGWDRVIVFGSRIGDAITKVTGTMVLVAGSLGWLSRRAKPVLALAEWLREELVETEQARLDALSFEVRLAEKRVAEAADRVAQAELAVEESSVPRRIQRFIEERVTSGEYERHLGIIAVVRRDFEIMSNLMERSRKEASQEQFPADGKFGCGWAEQPPVIDRIILYIDDLDRCPPQRVVQVLEAIRLLLAFPLFVVIVGLDIRWALRSLAQN